MLDKAAQSSGTESRSISAVIRPEDGLVSQAQTDGGGNRYFDCHCPSHSS
jgi:hypothetical protein